MNYRLLSSISLEAISIALFLVLALGVVFFVCISRKSKAASYVPIDKQRAGRSKRVLSILFAILSLSLILGSSIAISNQSASQDANSVPTYKISKDVNLREASDLDNREDVTPDKTIILSVNKIRNADNNHIFAIENKTIREVKFVYYRSKKQSNAEYYGELYIQVQEGEKISTISKKIFRHSVENDPSVYYYITTENTSSTNKSDQYVIQDYNTSWIDDQWFEIFKEFLDNNIAAIIITLLVAATFLAIILGINMAKAPDAGTAGKFKTRMWQLFIGLFVLIAAIFFLYWILDNISTITESGGAIDNLRDGFGSSNFKSFLDK